jgi:hypothetical protein
MRLSVLLPDDKAIQKPVMYDDDLEKAIDASSLLLFTRDLKLIKGVCDAFLGRDLVAEQLHIEFKTMPAAQKKAMSPSYLRSWRFKNQFRLYTAKHSPEVRTALAIRRIEFLAKRRMANRPARESFEYYAQTPAFKLCDPNVHRQIEIRFPAMPVARIQRTLKPYT